MDQETADGFIYMLIGLYFLPTIVAILRGHLALFSIVLLNIVFGWTLIGWFAALIWAANSNTKVNRQIAVFGRPQDTLGGAADRIGGSIKRTLRDRAGAPPHADPMRR